MFYPLYHISLNATLIESNFCSVRNLYHISQICARVHEHYYTETVSENQMIGLNYYIATTINCRILLKFNYGRTYPLLDIYRKSRFRLLTPTLTAKNTGVVSKINLEGTLDSC